MNDGITMTDPADRRRTVFVRHEHRADFEARGYEPVDSDEQRKPRPAPVAVEDAPAASEEAEAPATAEDDGTPGEIEGSESTTQDEPPAPQPAVNFPRRSRRSTAAG